MSTTYAQKQATAQKKDAPTAASILDTSSQSESLQRKADMANNAAQREEAPRPNNTGMPDNLKAGIESLSGFSMDDVRVHYNSSKPATVQALAYTQGTDIHVAPGQEKHLPHEAWHVAQQMAGRVSPTTNINGMPVNDNAELEQEADIMGEKAFKELKTSQLKKTSLIPKTTQLALSENTLNVVGENHPESNARREEEKNYSELMTNSPNYWHEYEFSYHDNSSQLNYGDPRDFRYKQNFFYFQVFMDDLFKSYDAYKIGSKSPDDFGDCLIAAWSMLEQMDIMLSSQPFSSETNAFLLGGQVCLEQLMTDINISLKNPKIRNSNSFRDEYNNYKRAILQALGYQNIFGSTKEFNKPIERNKEEAKISEQRSDKMHEAAQENFKTPGVWKIGERHRDYIDKKYTKRNYNLVSRDDFNKELIEYKRKQLIYFRNLNKGA